MAKTTTVTNRQDALVVVATQVNTIMRKGSEALASKKQNKLAVILLGRLGKLGYDYFEFDEREGLSRIENRIAGRRERVTEKEFGYLCKMCEKYNVEIPKKRIN